MGKGRSDVVEYERFIIQRKTNKKVDGEVCGTVYNRRNSIVECGKIAIIKFNENSSSSKCKLNSSIQGASEGTKKEGRRTGGS